MTDYDVKGFTDNELIDVFHHIDRHTYPDRYEMIVAEMEKRHLFIKSTSDNSIISKNKYDLSPKTHEESRKDLLFRMQIGAFWGLAILAFALTCFYQRLVISVNGIVVERQVKCNELGNRCSTYYTIINENETIYYIAHPNNTALSRNIQVGSRIHKDFGKLDYTVDSVPQKDFHTIQYSFHLMVGLFLILQGLDAFLTSREKNSVI